MQIEPSNIKDFTAHDSSKPPTIIVAGKPFVADLDTCPKPQTIEIPTKDSIYFTMKTPDWERRIKMGPPVITTADFFVTMPRFSNDQGLEAHSVFSSFQDKIGNLWFGTHGGGVTRFDGKTAITFNNLGCNDVRAIIEDNNQNIWFGMGGCGLVKYDGKGFKAYTVKDGLPSNEIRTLFLDNKAKLWIGTDGYGVSCFDGTSFTNFNTDKGLSSNNILSVSQDKQGNMWFGTDRGAIAYDGKSFRSLTMADGLLNNYIKSIISDRKGNIWFGTGNGISCYNGKSFSNFTTDQGLVHNKVNRMVEDGNGNLWIGTYGGGVSKFNGHSFENFTKKQGLSSDFIMTITEDSKGNIWFGAEGGGVTCYEGAAVTSFSVEQGLPNNYIVSIMEDKKGNLWFGPRADGICRYDGKSFTNFSYYQGFLPSRVNAIFQDMKENIWFCTNSGFSRYNGKSFTNYNTFHGIRNSEVRCAFEDTLGNLWFGIENGGLTRLNKKSIATFTTAHGLPSNNIRAITNDAKGNLWIATFGGGLSCFNGKSFTNFDTSQGMVENFILSMKKDSKGNLWIATSNSGVNILRKEVLEKMGRHDSPFSKKNFEKLTTDEGLANNVAYDIVEDKKQNIFIGTNLGITVVKGGLKKGRSIATSDLEYYNQKTGYAIKDMNGQAMHVDSKGMIWGGTGHDLIRFDYTAVRKSNLVPQVYIQGIKINNQKPGWYALYSAQHSPESTSNYMGSSIDLEENISYGSSRSPRFRDSLVQKFKNIEFDSIARFYPVPLNLVLPYKNNNVTIEFNAIEPTKPALVQYQFILDGYDKDWSPITAQSFASFGNIAEGDYTFKVKAKSPDGVWSKPISYSFVVLPPWYRTWWAYIIYTSAVALLLYSMYKNRITRLEKQQAIQLQTVLGTQEEERKRISRDLHDDVGTKLSALKLFLSSLKSSVQKKQYDQADQLAVNSEQLINETIKDVREMLLNLSPGILEEFGFTTAIESLITKINQTNTIHFNVLVFGIKGNLKKEYELALYRITQELINNVLKHSESKNVSLQIGQRDEKIIIMIEDDGKGFDIDKHKTGYGLQNLEARTKLLHGSMQIDSQPGKGTSVSIEVPYKSF